MAKPPASSSSTPAIRGSAAADTRADSRAPWQISSRCPSRPKPVTSVSACTASSFDSACPGVFSFVVLATIAA